MQPFTINVNQLERVGSGLARPECVACTAAGVTWTSHVPPSGGRGVMRIDHDGSCHPLTAGNSAPGDFLPNGWSMEPGGSFAIANLGDSGGVWRLHADARCESVVARIEGQPMPPVNFVHRDERGRLWISVSTWRIPRDLAFHREVRDGFIALHDASGTRIVADGLGYANEIKLDPAGGYLYANETMARRLSRFAVTPSGLGQRETVVDYLDGVIPDGLEFDAQGGVWCASVMSNRLLRVAPDGSQHIIVEDCDAAEIAEAMRRWHDNDFSRTQMDIGASRTLRNISSITFGGSDLRDVYLGSLGGDSLLKFRSPMAGAEPPHWKF